jgi:serine/threonine protein kinase/lipoprotein NlpI
MAIKCPKCHSDNPDTKRFCGECGTQLLPTEEVSAPTETLEAAKEELTTGSTFAGRYQIIEELGKGGMGKVYKVHDTEIKEKVALKLLKPEIAADKKTIERFQNELKFARKISHRNVCRMYDLNKEEGSYYITMEYVPGEDLKSSIRRMGPLSAGKTISIAKQVCEGLAEAHGLGVVHRDLKPQNIMIDKDGNVRIMDFGIARSITGKGITGAGVMIGTPEYMSPEQVEAKDIDQRSDIYSLGVILYEMVTGRVPFEGDTPFTIGMKHKGETPRDPKELNAHIPDDLSGVILRCLEKDKEQRYQSAGEVRSELTRIENEIPTTQRVTTKRKITTERIGEKKWKMPAVYAAIAVILILLIVGGISLFTGRKKAIDSIAVLPFAYTGEDPDMEYLSDGITETIINNLSQLPSLKKVIARSSIFRYKGKELDPQAIGKELGVDTVLISKMSHRGDDLSISVELVNTIDSSRMWGNQYKRKISEIFDVQDEISNAITDNLRLSLTGEELERITKRFTEDSDAYQLYLKGRYFCNRRTEEYLKKAIEYFSQAIDKDPGYALAYAGLAESYAALPDYSSLPPSETYPKATEAVLKALEIDSTLAEAHTMLAIIKLEYNWDWEGAGQEFRRALEFNPGYATGHFLYAFYLMYKARFDEAIKEIKRASELDPLNILIKTCVGTIFYCSRQYDQAMEALQRSLEMDPNFVNTHYNLGLIHLQKSRYEEALAEFQKEKSISKSGKPLLEPSIGVAYALMGEKGKARQVLDDLLERSRKMYVTPYGLALVYFSLEEREEGFKWLDKAIEVRDRWLCFLKVDPLFDSVRSDPRFTTLLKKIGLE